MISKHQPTTAQRRFYATIIEQGCCICGNDAEIHHIKGSSFKHNKTAIGNWYVLPLCPEHHRLGAINVTQNKAHFEAIFGSQWELFLEVVEKYNLPTEIKSVIFKKRIF